MRSRWVQFGLILLLPALVRAGEPKITHLFKLSDFAGTIPYSDVILHVDRQQDETYAVVGNTVRVFNRSGMETYRFQYDTAGGTIRDLVVDDSGDIFLLVYDLLAHGAERNWWITRCDYRGRPLGRIDVTGLPPAFAKLEPNWMFYRDGRLVLVSRSQLLVAAADESGVFQQGHELARILDIDDPGANEVFGFTFDRAGNMAFTIPTLFKVFVVAPDESVREFGAPGSIPGKFGVVAGIISDDYGNYLVSDKLRNVVMVFDSSLAFVTELTQETSQSPLNRPSRMAMGNDGRFLVTQSRNKGVSVFSLTQVHQTVDSLQKGGLIGSTETGTTSWNQDTNE